jgi:hypothetical protein
MSSSKEDLTITKPEVQQLSQVGDERGSVREARAGDDEFEVFKKNVKGEDYRTGHW